MKAESDHPTLLIKLMNKEFFKFVISGGINTAATYIVYLLLIVFLNYSLSYSVSYIIGVLLSYYLNSVFVFKESISLRKFFKFPMVYLVQYLINLLMLHLLVEYLNLSVQIVPLIVIVITIPITYLLSKIIIKSK